MSYPHLLYRGLLVAGLGACLPTERNIKQPVILPSPGPTVPWTTYQAEAMQTTGKVLGPRYEPHTIEAESSQQRCTRLEAGQFVEFTARGAANALVVRYSLPDTPDGGGQDSTLSLFCNGRLVRKIPITSRFSWLYGAYPFNNDPASGAPRNFYDEARVKNLSIRQGDHLRLQKDGKDGEDNASCTLDVVDLENVPAARSTPRDALSVAAFGANGAGTGDDTPALRNCIAEAAKQDKTVWLPPGTYTLTGDIELPSGVTLQGAGMWRTTLVGKAAQYGDSSRRVRLLGQGSHIRLADFAVVGQLNYRNDGEANDGVTGSFGTGSAFSRLWIEHTKTGFWLHNSQGLVVEACRVRDTIADGYNLSVGMRGATIQNSTARGTGDDGFAIWPATYLAQEFAPGLNVIRRCRAELPFLGSGAAIYGGQSNRIEDCVFQDALDNAALLISTTFPTSNTTQKVDNNFTGTTTIRHCELIRSGGAPWFGNFHPALQICLDQRSIAGLNVSHLSIRDSIADGIGIVAPGAATQGASLSNAKFTGVKVTNSGVGVLARHGLWIRHDARGSLHIEASNLSSIQNDSPTFQIIDR